MGSKTIQIVLNDKEYRTIEKEAKKKKLTVPLYIKSMALGNNDEFSKSYEKLIKEVDKQSSGQEFTVKELFVGVDWSSIPRGVKLTLGKTFYNRVVKGIIKDVKATGKDSSNVMHYRKL